jgi:hypothetical protein
MAKQSRLNSSFSYIQVSLPMRERFAHPEKTGMLFEALRRKKIPFVLELAVPHFGRHIQTILGAPLRRMPVLANIVRSLWGGVTLRETPGAPIGWNGSIITGANLLPAIHVASHPDQFLALMNHFAKMNLVGEGIVLRVLGMPGRNAKHMLFNIQLAASALTLFRAKALLHNALSAMPSFQAAGNKDRHFVDSLFTTEFAPAHAVTKISGTPLFIAYL